MISIIIVSCEKDEKYLWDALMSCWFPVVEYELILVYAGDTKTLRQDTRSALSSHKNHSITILEQDPGYSVCRNIAVAKSSGEYILLLYSDDVLFSYNLLLLWKNRNINADVIFGDAFFNSEYVCPSGRNGITKEMLLNTNPIFTTCLIKRTMWDKVKGMTPGMVYDDYNLFAKIFKAGGVFQYLPYAIYRHNVREDSVTFMVKDKVEEHNKQATECLR